MKRSIVFIVLIIGTTAFGQNKKNSKQPVKTETAPIDPKPAAPAPTEATPAATPANQEQQVNPFMNHFLLKFNVAMRFNDNDAARSALYDLIVENPANDSLFLNLAYMYYEAQTYPSTILVCQELLARNPKNTTAIELSASSFESLNIYDKALQNYETLYLQTNAYPALYKMAFLQYDLKRFKECSATSDILLSKKEADELTVSFSTADNKTKDYPIKVAILNLKGMVLIENGDKAGAKKLFDQALAIAPDFLQAKENLAKVK